MIIYRDDPLESEIKELRAKRGELIKKVNEVYDQIIEKENLFDKNKKHFFFDKKICLNCQSNLPEDYIDSKTIYCEECMETDSVLAWNSQLKD